MLIKNVEFNYVQVFEPRAYEGNTPEFSVTATLEPAHEQLKEINQAILDTATQKWGAKAAQMIEKGLLKTPLRDSDTVDYLEGGKWFFRAKTKANSSRPRNGAPVVVDAKRNNLTSADDCYSGCAGNVNVSFAAYDVSGNKGVGVYLNGVQVLVKGEPKAGMSTNQMFEEVEDGFTTDAQDMFE